MDSPTIRGVVENRLPGRLAKLRKGLLDAVRQSGEREGLILQRELQHELDGQTRNVQGDLRKSVNYNVAMTRTTMLLSVGPGVDYAPYVELGTKPHWVPIGPLIIWVHRRGLTGRYSVKNRKRLGKWSSQLHEDWEAASRIQFSIAKKGTKAHPFVGPVFNREEPRVIARFNANLSAALEAVDNG